MCTSMCIKSKCSCCTVGQKKRKWKCMFWTGYISCWGNLVYSAAAVKMKCNTSAGTGKVVGVLSTCKAKIM